MSSGQISSSFMFDRSSETELVASGLIGDGVDICMVKFPLLDNIDCCCSLSLDDELIW